MVEKQFNKHSSLDYIMTAIHELNKRTISLLSDIEKDLISNLPKLSIYENNDYLQHLYVFKKELTTTEKNELEEDLKNSPSLSNVQKRILNIINSKIS